MSKEKEKIIEQEIVNKTIDLFIEKLETIRENVKDKSFEEILNDISKSREFDFILDLFRHLKTVNCKSINSYHQFQKPINKDKEKSSTWTYEEGTSSTENSDYKFLFTFFKDFFKDMEKDFSEIVEKDPQIIQHLLKGLSFILSKNQSDETLTERQKKRKEDLEKKLDEYFNKEKEKQTPNDKE